VKHVAFILASLICAVSSAAPYHFDRFAGRLIVETDLAYFDTQNGASFNVFDGTITLNFYGWKTEEEWVSFTMLQMRDGTCFTDGGPNHELRARFDNFDVLTDSRPDLRAILCLFFERVHQPEVMCSSWFIAVRDGAPWRCDGETDRACAYYLPLLGDDDYRVREAAMTFFMDLGEQGAIWLLGLNHCDLSPEQAARIDIILRRYPV
jgi:hypothetical protein